MSGLVWSVKPEEAWGAMARAYADQVEADIVRFAQGLTDEITAYMKENHRWQNDTGAAEAGLYSDVIHVVRESVTVLMSHGPAVAHAWILEYAHTGRFEILSTTLDHFAPVIFRGVEGIVQGRSRAIQALNRA